MSENIKLLVSNLTKKFGEFCAVKDVSFGVRERSIHAVIGPNGAGKTTLFNCLAGRVLPTSGMIALNGLDVTKTPQHKRVQLGIARSFQITNIFQNLSVFENVRVGVQAKKKSGFRHFFADKSTFADVNEKTNQVLEYLRIDATRDMKAGELSHGYQRVLEIGMALASEPEVLLLDEPMAGLGVEDIGPVRDLIVELAKYRTVVLVEHNMNVVLAISDRVTVLCQGEVLAEGPPEVVRTDSRVQLAYLGIDA